MTMTVEITILSFIIAVEMGSLISVVMMQFQNSRRQQPRTRQVCLLQGAAGTCQQSDYRPGTQRSLVVSVSPQMKSHGQPIRILLDLYNRRNSGSQKPGLSQHRGESQSLTQIPTPYWVWSLPKKQNLDSWELKAHSGSTVKIKAYSEVAEGVSGSNYSGPSQSMGPPCGYFHSS